MSLERSKIIDIATDKAETALNDGNSKLAKNIINRAMLLLVHQGHPASVGWQIEIMSKINGASTTGPNIGNIAEVDSSHLGITMGALIARRQGRGHIGNNTKH